MQGEANGVATQRGTENQGAGVQRRGDIEDDRPSRADVRQWWEPTMVQREERTP